MSLATLLVITLLQPAADVNRWEEQIEAFEKQDRSQPPAQGAYLFIGSSSIRLWDLEKSFPDLKTINRGFGGSVIVDLVEFADRIIVPYHPRAIFIYSGDNDIGRGNSAAQVLADYETLVGHLLRQLPETKIYFLSIKPSLKRWHLVDEMRSANALIRQRTTEDPRLFFVDIDGPMIGDDGKPRKELFRDDGLHLNERGYAVWARQVREALEP